MSAKIEGKVVVITGASSGIGEATARLLSFQGATVVLAARRLDRIQAIAEELRKAGGKILATETDVTDREQEKRLVDGAVEKFGRVDVMLNNAGLMPHSPLERLKVDDWDRMIDVNLKGVLYGIAAVLPHMKNQKSGHIINTSSVAGHKVRPGSAVYAATKGSGFDDFRRFAPGSKALQHPHHRNLAGRAGYRVAEQRYGARCSRKPKEVL